MAVQARNSVSYCKSLEYRHTCLAEMTVSPTVVTWERISCWDVTATLTRLRIGARLHIVLLNPYRNSSFVCTLTCEYPSKLRQASFRAVIPVSCPFICSKACVIRSCKFPVISWNPHTTTGCKRRSIKRRVTMTAECWSAQEVNCTWWVSTRQNEDSNVPQLCFRPFSSSSFSSVDWS